MVLSAGRAPDGRLLILEVDRARREGPDIVPAIRAAVARQGLGVVWVEKAGFQLAIVQEARRAGVPVRELRPIGTRSAGPCPPRRRWRAGGSSSPGRRPGSGSSRRRCWPSPPAPTTTRSTASRTRLQVLAGGVGGSLVLAGAGPPRSEDDEEDDASSSPDAWLKDYMPRTAFGKDGRLLSVSEMFRDIRAPGGGPAVAPVGAGRPPSRRRRGRRGIRLPGRAAVPAGAREPSRPCSRPPASLWHLWRRGIGSRRPPGRGRPQGPRGRPDGRMAPFPTRARWTPHRAPRGARQVPGPRTPGRDGPRGGRPHARPGNLEIGPPHPPGIGGFRSPYGYQHPTMPPPLPPGVTHPPVGDINPCSTAPYTPSWRPRRPP